VTATNRARSDEAVRRLREESRLRIAGQRRRRSFAGWCAIATLASGISLAALDSRESFLREREAEAEAAERTELREKLREAAMERCQVLQRKRQAIEWRLDWDLRHAATDEDIAGLRADAARAFEDAARPLASDGCSARQMRNDYLRAKARRDHLCREAAFGACDCF
jgi:hypothetical protein